MNEMAFSFDEINNTVSVSIGDHKTWFHVDSSMTVRMGLWQCEVCLEHGLWEDTKALRDDIKAYYEILYQGLCSKYGLYKDKKGVQPREFISEWLNVKNG